MAIVHNGAGGQEAWILWSQLTGTRYLLGLMSAIRSPRPFSTNGRQIAAHRVEGWTTHSATAGRVAFSARALGERQSRDCHCLAEAAVSPASVIAVGAAGHGNGLYLLDGSDAPVAGIQSIDTSSCNSAELDAAVGGDVHGISLQRPWPAQTLVLLSWFKRHRPDSTPARTGCFLRRMCSPHFLRAITSRTSLMPREQECCACQRRSMMQHFWRSTGWKMPGACSHPCIGRRTSWEQYRKRRRRRPALPAARLWLLAISMSWRRRLDLARSSRALPRSSWEVGQSTRCLRQHPHATRGYSWWRPMGPAASSTWRTAQLPLSTRLVRSHVIARKGHADDPFELVNDAVGSVVRPPAIRCFTRLSMAAVSLISAAASRHWWMALEDTCSGHPRRRDVHHDTRCLPQPVLRSIDRLSGGGARSPYWPQVFADGVGVPVYPGLR